MSESWHGLPGASPKPLKRSLRERAPSLFVSAVVHVAAFMLATSVSGPAHRRPLGPGDEPLDGGPVDDVIMIPFPGAGAGSAGPTDPAPTPAPDLPPLPPVPEVPVIDAPPAITPPVVIDMPTTTRRTPSFEPDLRGGAPAMGRISGGGGGGVGGGGGTGRGGGGGGGGGGTVRAPVPISLMIPPSAPPKVRGGKATLLLHVNRLGRVV